MARYAIESALAEVEKHGTAARSSNHEIARLIDEGEYHDALAECSAWVREENNAQSWIVAAELSRRCGEHDLARRCDVAADKFMDDLAPAARDKVRADILENHDLGPNRPIEEHEVVTLLVDRPKDKLIRGDMGTAVSVHGHGEAFEVEFEAGGDRAWSVVTIPGTDVRRARPAELERARAHARTAASLPAEPSVTADHVASPTLQR